MNCAFYKESNGLWYFRGVNGEEKHLLLIAFIAAYIYIKQFVNINTDGIDRAFLVLFFYLFKK